MLECSASSLDATSPWHVLTTCAEQRREEMGAIKHGDDASVYRRHRSIPSGSRPATIPVRRPGSGP
ncbi:hypothetical protein BCEP4_250027 [Burkholderia cepacia]|nr:hypothetical protein BCEP4_250027 [Burkholderia cepacia]